jgi:iron complex outermembrane receptor protein
VFITLNRIINIPKSRVYGVEAEADWRVTRHLSLDLAATLLDSKIKEYQGFDLLGRPVDFSGREFTLTPKLQASASASWDMPVSETLGLAVTGLVSHQSRSWGDLENSAPYKVRGYTLVNADLSLYRLDDTWRWSAWANNLFDTYYWTYSGYERETIYRVAGMPRTFGLRVGRAFH